MGGLIMKKASLIFSAVAFFLSVSCASQPSNKTPRKPLYQLMREDYFKASPELSKDTMLKILQKQVDLGMTPAEVRLSWGEPDYKSLVNYGKIQFWSYEARYKPPIKVTFEDGKVVKKENTKKINLVEYKPKQRPIYSEPTRYGLNAAAKAETTKMTERFVDNVFKFNQPSFLKDPFKTIQNFENEFTKRGTQLELDIKNNKAIITPLDTLTKFSFSKALEDLIPGLPENITYVEIGSKELAGFLAGYQMHFSSKCREKTADGEIKEYLVVLNWHHSSLKKPDVFKTTVCGNIANIAEEGGLAKPLDIKNSFKKEAGKKVCVLADYFDCEPGKSYSMRANLNAPSGKLYSFGDGPTMKAKSYHLQYKLIIDLDSLILSLKEPFPGEYKINVFINTFLTETVHFTLIK